MAHPHKILALTMGDPAGIGPQISVRAWQKLKKENSFSFVFIGDIQVAKTAIRQLGIECPLHICVSAEEVPHAFPDALPILPINCSDVIVGETSPSHAPAVISSIKTAVDLTRSGQTHGVVTNPINKASLIAAEFPFPGHTEYLADLSDQAYPVMMLEGEGLKTIPLTRHVPLKNVPRLINKQDIIKTAQITHQALKKYFNISAPRIAISGLNPHAGEGGVLGGEEDNIIRPAISELKKQGINVFGPLPADTMFHLKARAAYDVAICMYHDQALIPVKMLGFDTGVNITLGLDFIRTSPDHGTALDIAQQYSASPDSLISALKMAAEMSAACTSRSS